MPLSIKTVSYAFVVAISCALSEPTFAQTGPTGTWRVEGAGRPFPWELVLKADGPRLVGAVNSCASNRGAIEIYDGQIVGNKITFKCKSKDRYRTVTLTGTVNSDEIAFTWALQVEQGGTNPFAASDGLFGASASPRFTAHRAPDAADDVAELADRVPGMEFSAAVNILPKDVKAEATIFVPQKVTRVRALLVSFNFGLGYQLFLAPQWPKLSETLDAALLSVRFSSIGPGPQKGIAVASGDGGTDALLGLLQRLAQESGHQELIDAPLLFWGHSGAGGQASTFASRFPKRTIAFVRYHSGPNPSGDFSLVSKIPALILEGGKDLPNNNAAAEILWKSGRAVGAPWTFAIDPDAPHGDEEDLRYLKKANDLMIPWITAVVRQRLSPDGPTLRAVTDGSAWMGNNRTAEVAPYGSFPGSKTEASWLPDEATARAWQTVLGAAK